MQSSISDYHNLLLILLACYIFFLKTICLFAPHSALAKHLITFSHFLHLSTSFWMLIPNVNLESIYLPKNLKTFTCSNSWPYIFILNLLFFSFLWNKLTAFLQLRTKNLTRLPSFLPYLLPPAGFSLHVSFLLVSIRHHHLHTVIFPIPVSICVCSTRRITK